VIPDYLVWPGLALLGVGVGIYGTIIGAGGGFLLVPVLIILYPDLPPESITALSLGVVFFNALSGTHAYARQKRIDYEAGLIFTTTTIPSAVLGALATGLLAAEAFEIAFAVFLAVAAVWLLLPRPTAVRTTPPSPRMRRHSITDIDNFTYVYWFDPWLAMLLGLVIGIAASLFGVGGGIFLVPAMVLLMRVPIHIATATSTFVLLFTGGTGAFVHLIAGHYAGLAGEELSLALGSLIGAQVGAVISRRLVNRQQVVARFFSVALLLVSGRMLAVALL
jgi:uncharacterized membrane protein YfcA